MESNFLYEVWREVDEDPEYEVSNFGHIRSWKPLRHCAPIPSEPRLLAISRDKDGYREVGLYVAGISRIERVPALVAAAFHGPRPEGLEVRHLDDNKDHDWVCNLAWGTPAENAGDRRRHGTQTHGEDVNTAVLGVDDVRFVLSSNRGHSDLAREFGVTPSAIWHIRAGRTWQHVAR